jgi:tryptophan synthase alpha chain
MNRIEKTFKQGPVFAAYITAGDGSLENQIAYIEALIAGGVNLLEIGVPFSDPIADGVVIQRAMQRALASGTTIFDVLNLIKLLRSKTDIPIILFTYYNPILAMAKHHILQQAADAGVDGILVVDLPFFEAKAHLDSCEQLNLAPIAVIAPTTQAARLPNMLKRAKGFLYYACRKGTTGVKDGLPSDVGEKIAQIKQTSDLPVIVGFGIADKASAKSALAVADGFVVGSYFVQAIEDGVTPQALTQLTKNIYST